MVVAVMKTGLHFDWCAIDKPLARSREWLTENAMGNTGSINLPKTNAYEEEIRYFVKCVQNRTFPTEVKPEELRAVIRILNNL